ncbi:sugar kinase [Marisediminicola antarctica]|nr:sugar kinase [Marisediminicola antarctica]
MTGVDVVTFGETMGSLRAAGLIRMGGAMSMTLGGAESNVAIGLARLGHAVCWAGRLGADEVGDFALRTLRAEGVDTRLVARDADRTTGLLLIEKRIADISCVAYYRAGSAGSALDAGDLRHLFDQAPSVMHVTGITPALSPTAAAATLWAVDAARERGVTVSFDINFRGKLWGRDEAAGVLATIARKAQVVFASDDELSLVAPGGESAAVAELIDAGVTEVVVKRGALGATAWVDGLEASVPAHVVPVVDTIGAGDAFTAGYLSARLDGLGLEERLERGAVLGAFAVSAAGDWESLPTRDELELLAGTAGSTIR